MKLALLICFFASQIVFAQSAPIGNGSGGVRVWTWGLGKPKKSISEKEVEELRKELDDAKEEARKLRRKSREKDIESSKLEIKGKTDKALKAKKESEELAAEAEKFDAHIEKLKEHLKEAKADWREELREERRGGDGSD